MTVTIELSDEIETALKSLAQARGQSLPEAIRSLLETQVAQSRSTLTPPQRASLWRAAAKGLPEAPLLSDEAVSRAGNYARD